MSNLAGGGGALAISQGEGYPLPAPKSRSKSALVTPVVQPMYESVTSSHTDGEAARSKSNVSEVQREGRGGQVGLS